MTGRGTMRVEAHAETRIVLQPDTSFTNHFPFLQSWAGVCRTFDGRMTSPNAVRTSICNPVASTPEQIFRISLSQRRFKLTVLTPRTEPQDCGIIKVVQWDADHGHVLWYTELKGQSFAFSCVPHQVNMSVLPMECAFDMKIQTRMAQCTRTLDKNTNPAEYFGQLGMAITCTHPAPRFPVLYI